MGSSKLTTWRDAVDVDAAGGDVGGDQGAQLAGLEGGQGAFALALALVAVDGGGLDAGGFQVLAATWSAPRLVRVKTRQRVQSVVGEQLGQQGALAALLRRR